ncbi:putative G1/S-specific cyclin Pcl5 [Aspergillus lucknowensis]|uniref:G1/S-specific cyclin Pcl5 n=1 Tax=Aspergillus lucknowensis TaxID=176173 RepID=A0ABR4M4U4_9EURO
MTGIDAFGLRDSNQGIPFKAPFPHPYASSIASSASSSSSSVFSLDGVSTQSSISSTSTSSGDVIWENEGEYQVGGRGLGATGGVRGCSRGDAPKAADATVPPELRRHPRRTSSSLQSSGVSCTRPPPCLLRQSERKVNFVDNLVDTASLIVEIIWPLSAVSLRSDSTTGCKGVLPLRTFIQETLRRSRTSYSTLQVALYYLIKIKPHVPSPDLAQDQSRSKPVCRAMQCGRRMFLAALILASKYLQDRNYSARAWSKISGLNTPEINQNELLFLEAVDWKLHIPEATFQRWTDIVLKYTPGAGSMLPLDTQSWRTVIPKLTPELDEIDDEPMTPTSMGGFDGGFASDSPSPRSTCTRGPIYPPSLNAEPNSLPAISQIPELNNRPESSHPSLPPIPRLPMLPTPQMTPQASNASTPAVSGSYRPSYRRQMCAAMSQSMCTARSIYDQRPSLSLCSKASTLDGFPTFMRRSSLARSTSSASSPESMVSDVSTLSSQSSRSSLSSSSYGPIAPTLPSLAVQAALRCTGNSLKENRKQHLPMASPIDEISFSDAPSSPETFSGSSKAPDFSSYSLGAPEDMTHEAAHSLCQLSETVSRPHGQGSQRRECRKRGRTGSDDVQLQRHVRHLMRSDTVVEGNIRPDGNLADLLHKPEPGKHSSPSLPSLSALGFGAPLSGPVGMKRACCGSEARKIALHPGLRADY